MAAPSSRQRASGKNGVGIVSVTLGSQPNVGNRLLAVCFVGNANSVTPNTGTWTLLDRVRSRNWAGSIDIFYKDVEPGDPLTWDFVTVGSASLLVNVHEFLNFTEAPVIREARFADGFDSDLPTLSVGANSMSILATNYAVNASPNIATGYTGFSSTSTRYVTYQYSTSPGTDLVATTNATTSLQLGVYIEIPEGGAATPAAWNHQMDYEISFTGDYSYLTTIPSALWSENLTQRINFNLTENRDYNDGASFIGAGVEATSTYYTSIYVDPSVRHDGVDPTTGAHVNVNSNNHGIEIRGGGAARYFNIDGLGFVITSITSWTGYNNLLYIDGSNDPCDISVQNCLFVDAVTGSGYTRNGIHCWRGTDSIANTMLFLSNSVFHSFQKGDNSSRNVAGLVIADDGTNGTPQKVYVDHCSFGFNGAPSGVGSQFHMAGIIIDQGGSSGVAELILHNNNFGDNVNNSITDIYDVATFHFNTLRNDGTVTISGSNNLVHNGIGVATPGDDVTTNEISAPNGFTAITTSTFGAIVNDTATFGAYDLNLVQATGGGINLAVDAGVNRIGSEPDSRHNFGFDILGKQRSTSRIDTGAFQLSSASGFKYWNGSAWVNSVSVKYWNGTAWVDTVAVKYWNGSAWTDPV
jgi:hypothetical protein